MAALRAFGAREPDESVRNPDWLAERMVTPADLELIHDHPVVAALGQEYKTARQNPEVAAMSNLLLVRTRYIDDGLQRAIEDGVTQFVILGAGFDTRAYRFAKQLEGKQVFEIDYHSTQELKKQRLKDALGSLPADVRFTEIDFKRDSLRDVLKAAGYKPTEETFFIWEGVSMYLSAEAVQKALRTISEYSAPGSSLMMDFAEQASVLMFAKFPDLSQHKYTTRWGEPWIFGLPDLRERDCFRNCGLELRDILGLFSREAADRYLKREDGSLLGRTFTRRPSDRSSAPSLRVIWFFLTHRSRWYAIADLVVPE